MNESAGNSQRRYLSWTLAGLFVLTMVMGAGPGVLLVNRPETFFGLPLVYAWGIFWYLVQVAIAIVAYVTIWKDTPESESASAGVRP